MTATQLPHKLRASILGQATDLVCFRLHESLALGKVKGMGGRPRRSAGTATGRLYRMEPAVRRPAGREALLIRLHHEEQVPDLLTDGATPLQAHPATFAKQVG